jgi:hypothetical protein
MIVIRQRLTAAWSATQPARDGASSLVRSAARWEAGVEAAKVFVLTRAVILLVAFIAVMTLPIAGASDAQMATARSFAWYHYDAILFIGIAQHGYSGPNTAFFPLWPLLIRGMAMVLGGSFGAYYWGAIALSNLCFLLILVLFYRLLDDEFGAEVARRGILYLALYPYALFFFAGYSESLFLLLTLSVFLALRIESEQSWWLAGALGLLAALTRTTGIVLVVPFVTLWWQRIRAGDLAGKVTWWHRGRVLAPSTLIPAGTVGYILYLGRTQGYLLQFSSMEAQVWGRHLAPPWEGILGAMRALFSGALPTLNLMDLLFALIPMTFVILGWKRLPEHYSLFAAALIIFALCAPVRYPEPLASAPRYLMVAFPIFMVWTQWGKRAYFDRAYLAVGASLLALNVVLFTTHHWVA